MIEINQLILIIIDLRVNIKVSTDRGFVHATFDFSRVEKRSGKGLLDLESGIDHQIFKMGQ